MKDRIIAAILLPFVIVGVAILSMFDRRRDV